MTRSALLADEAQERIAATAEKWVVASDIERRHLEVLTITDLTADHIKRDVYRLVPMPPAEVAELILRGKAEKEEERRRAFDIEVKRLREHLDREAEAQQRRNEGRL